MTSRLLLCFLLLGCIACSEPQDLEFLDELVDGGARDAGDCSDAGRVGEVCSVGKGACERAGTYECVDALVVCSATPGTPSDELCDTERDEDCDGTVDEAPQGGCCQNGDCDELETCDRPSADAFAAGICASAGDENRECTQEGEEIVCSCRLGYEGEACVRNACVPLEGEDPPCGVNESCEPTDPGEKSCSCTEDFADCDDDAENGCEIETAASAQNCGACGYACVAGLACTEGACVPRFAKLTLGFSTTLGVTPAGDVLGAGHESWLLGHTDDSATFTPIDVGSAGAISANVDHACLLRPEGDGATCWGSNAQLAIGSADTDDRYQDLAVVGARSISAGENHTCLVDSDGFVYCWGDGLSGELGDGQTRTRDFPGRTFTEAVGGDLRVHYVENAIDVQSGSDINCALTSAGFVYCWGYDAAAYPPEFVRDASAAPLDDAVSICTGSNHGCALREDGTLVCWGDDGNGQLGSDDVPEGRNRYVTVPLEDVASVACGSAHTCAVLDDGQAYCWGNNGQGQLGSGDTSSSPMPVPVLMTDLDAARSIHSGAGALSTCMQLRKGQVYCWGHNYYLQLGLGAGVAEAVAPTEVTEWP